MAQQSAILIVEDDPGIRQALAEGLGASGFATVVAPTAEDALAKLSVIAVDLALVDLKLPRMSGIDLLQVLRQRQPEMVLVLMTANPTVQSAIDALHLEAYEYLLKPFTLDRVLEVVTKGLERQRQRLKRELLLRQLERTLSSLQSIPVPTSTAAAVAPAPPKAINPGVLSFGPIEIDLQRHMAFVNQRQMDLTPTEFNVLVTLVDQAPAVVAPQELLRQATGYQTDPAEARELVKWHIHHLRAKVESDPKEPKHIVTVRGVGYRLAAT